MANQHFHITISGDNYLFSKQITFEDLKKINYLLLENSSPPHTPASASAVRQTAQINQNSTSNLETDSLALMIKTAQAKRTPDKITVFAYYLRSNLDQPVFDKSDLIKCFELAQEPIPKNLNRDILWTKKNGWITEKIDQPGSYYLTQEGQAIFEAKFPKSQLKKTTIATVL